MEIEIKHDKGNQRFYTIINGKEAKLDYSFTNDKTINFRFTYVPPELRGRGIAAKIVEEGLKYAIESNYKIITSCSYVDLFIQRNEKYRDLMQ